MQTFQDSIGIEAPRERVWQALSVPSEVVCWDTGVIEPVDAPFDYPRAGQHVRWRYRLGPLPLTLHDRPTVVEPPSLLRSSIRLGPFDFDETYTLRWTDAEATHLTAELSVSAVPNFLGARFERLFGLPLARATVRSSLVAIKQHCEGAA
jgi:hypothetical protein